jgi:flagellum-specific peptidoglycan hydrolase FlgJ
MKLSYTNSNAGGNRRRSNGRVSRSEQGLHTGDTGHFFPVPNIWQLFRQLFAGIARLFVLLKFFLHNLMPNLKGEVKLPWFKIGIVAVAIFIVSKKDINFSINMHAPDFSEMTETTPVTKDEMSLVQTVSYKKPAARENVKNMPAPTTEDVKAYVKRFSKVARSEMEKFGIPASIKLAQGILESAAGKSKMAKVENNHFGRPLAEQSFGSAWENWRAHSIYLRSEFPSLFENGGSYKTWAKGLKKVRYSKDKNYDKKLIQIVERYQLYLLDEQI